MSSRKKTGPPKIICDASVWLQGLFGGDKSCRELIQKIVHGQISTFVNSYSVLEILRGAKRIARTIRLPPGIIESRIWNILTGESVELTFDRPLEEAILHQVRKQAEYRVLGQALDLETKDVPYLVLAFDKGAPLITVDIRSLYARRVELQEKLGILVTNPEEFLRSLSP